MTHHPRLQHGATRTLKRHFRAPPLRLVLLALLAAGLLTGACRPREIVPTQPALLVQPERDVIQYRRLVLSNGLKVMLVSDPQADESAAAMSVASGSLEDPPDRPGLAHFLEHMLFLGTEKYPQPNGYTQFLSAHAGSSNAYTADDHTNYFFDVEHSAFEEALDRFSQFFIAPLFNQDYTDREMNAVDSEHAKNIENDYWRMRQVQRMQYAPDHPISHFSTGNLETLKGVTGDELRRFYRQHYSSNLMALAVVGNRSLDALEKLVRERFGQVPDRELQHPHYPGQYLAPEPALRVLRVQPLADERQLALHFPLPPLVQDYDASPLRIISTVLGHEGEGSLLSVLKAKGLAHSLSAGKGEDTMDYSSLEVRIGLTPAGLERYREVIALTLGTIDGLRKQGVPRYIYEESRVMAELDYRFREIPSSGSIARQLSAMMQSYPLDALPEEPFLLRRYAPELYQDVLRRLTPDNMLVTLVAQSVPTDQVEHYYGARYSYEALKGPEYAALVQATPDASWHLPQPNPFIPRNVVLNDPAGPLKLGRVSQYHLQADGLPAPLLEQLKPLQGETYTSGEAFIGRVRGLLSPDQEAQWLPVLLQDAVALPVRLLDTPQARVWYEPDWRFRQPKAEVRLKFYVEGAYADPRRVVLASLYEAALEEGLNELGYPIRQAGLSYGVRDVKGGVLLSLSGYSARMVDLLHLLIDRMQRIDVDQRTFASIKERMRRDLVNQRLDQPYRQSRYFVHLLLEQPNFTREALLEALEPVSLEDVQAYARTFLRRTYVEGVVVGNLRRDEARAAIGQALDSLGADVLPPERRMEPEVRELPRNANWVFSDRLSVNNSLMQLLYQVGPREPELEGALAIISRPLGEGFYHQMRTQQQLGYIVWAGVGEMRRMLNLSFLVQSGQYPADELRRRMEAYIPDFVQSFRSLPDAAFEQYRNAVIQSRLERAGSLAEVASGLYWSAFRNDERFDYVSEQLAALERLTRAEVEAVLVRYLEGAGERRLAIRLIGAGHEAGPTAGEPVRLPPAVQAKAG